MAVPIAALVALGQAGYQYYQAQKQKKEAKKLKPSNYTPPSINEAVATARMESNSLSPGYNRSLEQLRKSTADSIDATKRIGGSQSSIQQAVAGADAREKETIKDIEVNESSWRTKQKDNLKNLLVSKAGFENQSQDAYNASVSALRGAAAQNEYNAISSAAEGVVYSLPDNAISPDGTTATTAKSRKATTGSAMGRFGYNGRYATRTRNFNYTPYEEAILRSKGLL